MTVSPESAISSGLPLWQCSEGHHGPSFVGAQQ